MSGPWLPSIGRAVNANADPSGAYAAVVSRTLRFRAISTATPGDAAGGSVLGEDAADSVAEADGGGAEATGDDWPGPALWLAAGVVLAVSDGDAVVVAARLGLGVTSGSRS